MKKKSEIWLAATAANVDVISGALPLQKIGATVDLALDMYAREYTLHFIKYLIKNGFIVMEGKESESLMIHDTITDFNNSLNTKKPETINA